MQATLLEKLRSRMIFGGFPLVSYHIVHLNHSASSDEEIKHITKDIKVYKGSKTQDWVKGLGAEKDHVLVFDSCYRLTFQVITPWSILHYPFVKAAILSTYKDDPCGPCNVQPNLNLDNTIIKKDSEEFNDVSGNYELDVRTTSTPDQSNATQTTTIFPAVEDSEEFNNISGNDELDVPTTSTPDKSNATHTKTIFPAVEELENIPNNEKHTTLRPKRKYIKKDLTGVVETDENEMMPVPLKMIFHEPHTHRKGNSETSHRYLVLKTGHPEFHGHLDKDINGIEENFISSKEGIDYEDEWFKESKKASKFSTLEDIERKNFDPNDMWRVKNVAIDDNMIPEDVKYIISDQMNATESQESVAWPEDTSTEFTKANTTSVESSTIRTDTETIKPGDIEILTTSNESSTQDVPEDNNIVTPIEKSDTKTETTEAEEIIEEELETDIENNKIEKLQKVDKEKEEEDLVLQHYSKLLPYINYNI